MAFEWGFSDDIAYGSYRTFATIAALKRRTCLMQAQGKVAFCVYTSVPDLLLTKVSLARSDSN